MKEAKESLSTTYGKLSVIQSEIRRLLSEDRAGDGRKAARVLSLLKEFEGFRKEAVRQLDEYRAKQSKAYASLSMHRLAQNLLGGGRNDLAALLYYKNEFKYVKASASMPYVEIDTMLIQRAADYVNRNRAVAVAGIQQVKEITDEGNTEKNSEAVESIQSDTTPELAGTDNKISGAVDAKTNDKKKHPVRKLITGVACCVLIACFMYGAGLYATGRNLMEVKQAFIDAPGRLAGMLTSHEKKTENHVFLTDKAEEKDSSGISYAVAELKKTEATDEGGNEKPDEAIAGDVPVETENSTVREMSETEQPQTCVYTVDTQLNLRSEPSAEQGESTILTAMESGAQCIGTGAFSEDERWAEVAYENADGAVTGWANLNYLSIVSEVENTQIADQNEQSVSGGKALMQEAQDYWNSEEGQTMVHEAQDYWNSEEGQAMVQEAQDYWNSEEGQAMVQEAKEYWNSESGQSMIREAQEYWNSAQGQAMMQEAMDYWNR